MTFWLLFLLIEGIINTHPLGPRQPLHTKGQDQRKWGPHEWAHSPFEARVYYCMQ